MICCRDERYAALDPTLVLCVLLAIYTLSLQHGYEKYYHIDVTHALSKLNMNSETE